MFYVKHSFTKFVEGKPETHWNLFKVSGKLYTKNVIAQIREYLAKNCNTEFLLVSDDQIKNRYTCKYEEDEYSVNEKWEMHELKTYNSSDWAYSRFVQIVELSA